MTTKELLQWYHDMGVDETIMDEAVDHTKPKTLAKPATAQQTAPAPAAPTPAQPKKEFAAPSEWAIKARDIAEGCETLEALEQAVRNFDGCSLKKMATNTVFSDGQPNSDIMLVGEAPGANEDMQGIPFCGVSGQLLDNMMQAIGYSRAKNLYITNTIFWRPPGNRKPTQEELNMCSPFVERHIALLKPKLIIMVGKTAIEGLLGETKPISTMRGKFFDYKNRYLDHTIPSTAIFHPSYLLRSPTKKGESWKDLQKIKAFIDEQL